MRELAVVEEVVHRFSNLVIKFWNGIVFIFVLCCCLPVGLFFLEISHCLHSLFFDFLLLKFFLLQLSLFKFFIYVKFELRFEQSVGFLNSVSQKSLVLGLRVLGFGIGIALFLEGFIESRLIRLIAFI